MSVFICNTKDCPNANVIYDFGDEHPTTAICGGCHATLLPEEN
jgi:hypothetical protein